MNTEKLLDEFQNEIYCGRFNPDYVNDKRYIEFYRLHARTCGLIAKIGFISGYIVDINRRFPIEPIKKRNNRYQKQAEADVSFIDRETDLPIALFDFETSDAPIEKIRAKFSYFHSFKKMSRSIELLSLIVTITEVQHSWKKSDGTGENNEERQQFAKGELIKLCRRASGSRYNRDIELLLGIFKPDFLDFSLLQNGKIVNTRKIQYK